VSDSKERGEGLTRKELIGTGAGGGGGGGIA
jgi:hypothetical protein